MPDTMPQLPSSGRPGFLDFLRRRRWLILSAILGIAVVAGAGIFLLQSEGPLPELIRQGTLPSNESGQELDQAQEDGTTIQPLSSTEQPSQPGGTAPAASETQQQTLVVHLRRTPSSTFDLEIIDLSRSFSRPTIEQLRPGEGQPFSVMKLVSGGGTTLSEERFFVPSEIILENFDTGEGSTQALVGTELEYVIPVTRSAEIASLVVETSTGRRLDRREFQFSQLPEFSFEKPISSIEAPRWARAWQALQRFGASAAALAQTGPAPRQFTIAVTNMPSALGSLSNATQSTQAILKLDPWKTFADKGQIRIVSVPNSTVDLGCKSIPVVGGNRMMPGCPNAGRVLNYLLNHPDVQLTNVDGVLVTVNEPCNCGATNLGSGVSGIGTQASQLAVAHEFGHALPKDTPLDDEYLYRFPDVRARPAPNCFPTQTECEQANARFSGNSQAQCFLGCNAPNTFRPTDNDIMNRGKAFGPLEASILSAHIAKVLGTQTGEPGNPIPAPDGQTDSYWGGRRAR